MKSSSLLSCSLFSGIGGLHVGQPLLYCDIDRHCRRVLQARMDDGSLKTAPIHEDVRTLTELPAGTQLLLAGFPCQDLSSAGLKAGVTNGKRSGLFFEVVRLAKAGRPQYVFLENVNNIRFLPSWKIVLQNMHSIGYNMRWVTTTAEAAGANHKRERWFCLCNLVREPSNNTLEFVDAEMLPCGQLIQGEYSQTAKVAGLPPSIEITLLPLSGPRVCQSTNLVTKPLKRVRWATTRANGGSFPALGLTKRCSHDLSTQLRFEQHTSDRQRWLDHARPSADWTDMFMGFPAGWSDYMFPLQSKQHSFTEDTSIPRLIISNIPNSHRLAMLGNCCVPQQCTLAFDECWSRLRQYEAGELPAQLPPRKIKKRKRSNSSCKSTKVKTHI